LSSFINSTLRWSFSDLQTTFLTQQVLSIITLYIFVLITPYANGFFFFAPYCVLSSMASLSVSCFFFSFWYLSRKWHDFQKKKSYMKYMFWFPLHLFSEAVSFLGKIQQDIIINIPSVSCKMPDILFRFQPNYNCLSSPQYKFIQNPSSGNQVVPCRRADGQIDRHDEANSH